MLGYRMFMSAANLPHLLEDAEYELGKWLREKKWTQNEPSEDGPTWVAPNVRTTVVSHVHSKGGRTRRHRFVEQQGAGQWITELTVHQGANSATGWIWLDVHRPDNGPRTVSTPRLAGMLLDLIQARDGRYLVIPEPSIVTRDEVIDLIGRLTDPERRGLVFVAAENIRKQDREEIRDHVRRLTIGTVGVATAFVLTQAAAEEFGTAVGSTHQVSPGSLRTFLPQVVLRSRVDGMRHRFLTPETFAASKKHPAATERVLTSRSRDLALNTRLPDGVLAVDKLLRKKLDDLLLAPAPGIVAHPVFRAATTEPAAATIVERPAEPEVPLAPVGTESQATRSPRPTPLMMLRNLPKRKATQAPLPHAPEPTTDGDIDTVKVVPEVAAPAEAAVSPAAVSILVEDRPEPAIPARKEVPAEAAQSATAATSAGPTLNVESVQIISQTLGSILGVHTMSTDSVLQLCELAFAGKNANLAREDLRSRMSGLETELEHSWTEVETIRHRLEEAQLDHADDTDRLREIEHENRQLRLRMSQLGAAAEAWATPEADPRDSSPEAFDELLLRLGELTHVEFTGDESTTIDLSDHDPVGRWAGKVWDALLALDDFGKVRTTGYQGNVEMYLANPPEPGCHVWAANRHASDESEDVHTNRKYWGPRVLPVPREVDSTGSKFMGAHFKIAQYGMISPRLHYLDDTANTGKIYVGYIGPHLPTKQTN